MKTFIDVKEYSYELPAGRIAMYPLPQREQSKLLVYDGGSILHQTFDTLPNALPANATLIINNTRVIPARVLFQKETGAEIEIFLLHPVFPSTDVRKTMSTSGPVQWQCVVGNLKRWNDGFVLAKNNDHGSLHARLINRDGLVELVSIPERPFAESIQLFGETPLPPYIRRKAEDSDSERYQTVYSENAGAVAAPTAGLHFTPGILEQLKERDVTIESLTLHVSAGTFLPVKATNAIEHEMHGEQVVVSDRLIHSILSSKGPIIAVGTTSLRTLESLYWYGIKLRSDPGAEFSIGKLDAYQTNGPLPSAKEVFQNLAEYMNRKGLNLLSGETSIYILPGYSFRVVEGLITNFHQPRSTLLLLIAAFIGEDWKRVYAEALQNNYRFLSYGDSSLLMRG